MLETITTLPLVVNDSNVHDLSPEAERGAHRHPPTSSRASGWGVRLAIPQYLVRRQFGIRMSSISKCQLSKFLLEKRKSFAVSTQLNESDYVP